MFPFISTMHVLCIFFTCTIDHFLSLIRILYILERLALLCDLSVFSSLLFCPLTLLVMLLPSFFTYSKLLIISSWLLDFKS